MAKLDKRVDREGFNGVRDAAKIGKLDQHKLAIQFIDDGARCLCEPM